MADLDVIRMEWGDGNFAAIEYRDNNNRINRIYVHVEPGYTMRALVWNLNSGGNPPDPATAVVDLSFAGPTDDEFNVPGNHQLVEITDADGTYLELPDYFKYQVIVRNNG